MIGNDNKEYYITQLDESKLNDVATLYKAVYGHKCDKNYLFKKYNTAYTGVQYVGHLAYNNENIPIAFFSVLPCFIQFENKIILAAQAVDAMTHPQYRYKG